MSPPIRIVVGEADYLAREGLVRAIEAVADIEVVSICSSISALRHAVEGEPPDVVDPAAVGTFLDAARQPRNVTLDRLTVREREVLGLLAAAESNNAIARDLGITTRAVERHVNSIFRKLDLEDSGDLNRRVQAALI